VLVAEHFYAALVVLIFTTSLCPVPACFLAMTLFPSFVLSFPKIRRCAREQLALT